MKFNNQFEISKFMLILLQLLTQSNLSVNLLALLLTSVNFDSKFHHSSTSFIPPFTFMEI